MSSHKAHLIKFQRNMSHRLCCLYCNEKLEISELERPYVCKLAELSLQMTMVFIWKLEWNGHLPRKMFLTQNGLIEKQTTLITNKGSESVVRKSFHETISIFYVLSGDRTNSIEFFHRGDELVNLCQEDLEMWMCCISLSNKKAVDGISRCMDIQHAVEP